MVKAEIISFIRGLLPAIDKTEKYKIRYLTAAIEKIINEMYVELWSANPMLLDGFTKSYTGIAVNTEPSGNYFGYFILLVPIVPIPDKCSGVSHIYTIL